MSGSEVENVKRDLHMLLKAQFCFLQLEVTINFLSSGDATFSETFAAKKSRVWWKKLRFDKIAEVLLSLV